ncbi:MAG: DUF4185 domain-containing protein [Allorhizobium sp.]
MFSDLEWVTESSRYPGTNSDMHWATWTADGTIYTVDDDGVNFGSPPNFAQLMRVEGTPPNHTVSLVTQFPDLIRPADNRCTRYVDGALAIGDRIYVAAYDYDFNAPGFEDDFNIVNLISPHGGVVALMFSDDRGETWQNVPGVEVGPEDYFLGERFAGLAFVAFGPGYTGVPDRLGEYVYAISNDRNWETGDNIFLARAPIASVQDRSTWQFFASHGEGASAIDEPIWSSVESEARPILRDPGRVGHPTMTYSAPIDRFILTYGTDSVPHTLSTPKDVAVETWDKRVELMVLEGPTPWGPWSLVHHDPSWEYPHTPYLPQVPTKWLDEDGAGGWMIFSGDWVIGNFRGDYYGFMTRRFRLTPHAETA